MTQKSKEDLSFDYEEAYSWNIERRFFEPTDRFYEPVYVFSDELHVLHKFYEYSFAHMRRYIDEEKTAYQTMDWESEGEYSGEYEMFFQEMMYMDEDYMLNTNHAAVLLLLYALFENFLKSLSKMIEDEGFPSFMKDKRREALVDQYIDYLRKDCGLDFKINNILRKRLTLMRKVRNYFVHDYKGGGEIDLNKYEDCKPLPQIVKQQMTLNYKYVISCFKTVGDISQIISEALP